MMRPPHRSSLLLLTLLGGACQDSLISSSNRTPRAVITVPGPADEVPDTSPLVLEGSVGDDETPPDQLAVTWRVDSAWVCLDSVPDTDGLVRCELPPPGDRASVRVTLGVRDAQGSPGADTRTFGVRRTGAPSVRITGPTPDEVLRTDRDLVLAAEAQDAETAPPALRIGWTSSLDGALTGDPVAPDDAGRAAVSVRLSAGTHLLTVRATDEDDKVGLDVVTVVVRPPNAPPTCALTTPLPSEPSVAGAPVVLSGRVSDDGPADALVATWSSDVDGALGAVTPTTTGEATLAVDGLSAGTHVLTLSVSDPDGLACSDQVVHQVGSPPVLSIPEPVADGVFATAAPVRLTAVVQDAEDAPGSIVLSWTSSLDGDLAGPQPDASGTATFTRTDLSVGPHTLQVRATDPLGLAVVRTVDLRVDTAPLGPALAVLPSDPLTSHDLQADVTTPASDPDGDRVQLTWAWTRDGVLQPAYTGPVVPHTATAKGQVWSVRATPDDGWLTGRTTEAFTTIGNSAPVLGPVALARGGGTLVGAELTCGAAPFDADNDPLSTSYAWVLLGSPVATGPTWTVPGGGAAPPGSVVTCEVTVRDVDGAADVGSAAAVVGNAPPRVDSVALVPASGVDPGTLLTCTAEASDPDGPPPTLSYRWTLGDGTVLGGGPTLKLTPTSAPPASVVTCTATAVDALGGEATGSAAVVVLDPYPRIDAVSVTVEGGGPPLATSTLSCTYAGYADPQGDADASRIVWRVDGAVVGSTRYLKDAFARGQEAVCTVTPSDGTWDGQPRSASVLVQDSPPRIASVVLAPLPTAPGRALTCSYTGFADDDGDPDASTFAWTADGVPVGSGAALPGGGAAGVVLACTVTPRAGGAAGTPLTATTRVDAPPGAPGITVTPADPADTDTLSCLVSQPAVDPDGDPLTYTIRWLRDGASTAYEGSGLGPAQAVDVPPSATRADEVWTCEATASDGLVEGPTARVSVEVGCLPHSGRGRSCPADSCLDALETDPTLPSGVAWLDPDGSHVFRAWCDQEEDDGGWTLVMQAATRSQLFYEHPWWTALDGGDDVPWSLTSDLDAVSRAFYHLAAVETRMCVRTYDEGEWACETMTHSRATGQVLATGAPLTTTRATRDKLTANLLRIPPAGVWTALGYQRWGWNHDTRFCGGLRVGFSSDGDTTDSRDSAIGIGFHLENHICNPLDYLALDYGAGFYHYPWPDRPSPNAAPLPVRIWMR